MTDADVIRKQLAEYLRTNPDTSAIEAVATVGADPAQWVDIVDDALNAVDPYTTLVASAEDMDTDSAGTTDTADVADGRTDAEDSNRSPDDADKNSNPEDENHSYETTGSGPTTSPNQHTDIGDSAALINGGQPTFDVWGDADFSIVEPGTYPPELLNRESWMGQLAGEKLPFAPWGNADHPMARKRKMLDINGESQITTLTARLSRLLRTIHASAAGYSSNVRVTRTHSLMATMSAIPRPAKFTPCSSRC